MELYIRQFYIYVKTIILI